MPRLTTLREVPCPRHHQTGNRVAHYLEVLTNAVSIGDCVETLIWLYDALFMRKDIKKDKYDVSGNRGDREVACRNSLLSQVIQVVIIVLVMTRRIYLSENVACLHPRTRFRMWTMCPCR